MKTLLSSLKSYFNIFYAKISNFRINVNIFVFTFLYSLFTLVIYNFKFFKFVYLIRHSFLAVVVSFLIILCIYNIIFTIFFQRKITKFLAIVLLLINAGMLYFMNVYNVAIDGVMLLNVVETNIQETLELLNLKFFLYLLFLGLLPSLFVVKTNINRDSFLRENLKKLIVVAISLFIGLFIILISYRGLSSTVRNNKGLKHILIPFNYFDANFSLAKKYINSLKNMQFNDLTDDTKLQLKSKNGKKNLVIFVVGEAARAKNFSLGGYNTDTNKYLANQNLIYFKNFYSCGTSTAISVPCMFSSFPRVDYDVDKKMYSNLLDFMQKVNFNVLWRENNSDCKGVCLRTKTDNLLHANNNKYCNDKECYDEILLDGLQEQINNFKDQNNFIVLHQKGSHGPAYYLRYPEKFKKYKPICESEYFNDCTKEEVVNSYNNTLNYTSFVLNKAIELLKNNSKNFNVALIYVSDHGQSLGEKNMYLHGAPYRFAPEEQKHIPFFMWFSNDFRKEFDIDEKCLKNKINEELSHDNIFHSMLGMFGIETKYYNRDLDIFYSCRKKIE